MSEAERAELLAALLAERYGTAAELERERKRT